MKVHIRERVGSLNYNTLLLWTKAVSSFKQWTDIYVQPLYCKDGLSWTRDVGNV